MELDLAPDRLPDTHEERVEALYACLETGIK
jgi:hypothetical protein